MPETPSEIPNNWKVEQAKNFLMPGLYEQVMKEYPWIKIEPYPWRQVNVIISYNWKDVKIWPRMWKVTVDEIRDLFGEPTSPQKQIDVSWGFNISRISTRALEYLERCCDIFPTVAKYDGKPWIWIRFKEGYSAYIRAENWEQWNVNGWFVLASYVMKTELLSPWKWRGAPFILQNTWDDWIKETITIYRTDIWFNPQTGTISN